MTDAPDATPRADAPPTLTARQRADLKARAHPLEPVVRVGQAGLTDAVMVEVDRALSSHELIKVKLGQDDREARAAIGDEMCARAGAALVQRVGKVIVLWRPRADAPATATSPTPE